MHLDGARRHLAGPRYPIMSIWNTASIAARCAAWVRAYALLPIRPCSSALKRTKRMVRFRSLTWRILDGGYDRQHCSDATAVVVSTRSRIRCRVVGAGAEGGS
jgi:hypothetical protein